LKLAEFFHTFFADTVVNTPYATPVQLDHLEQVVRETGHHPTLMHLNVKKKAGL